MTTSAIEALRVESGRARELFASLSHDEWQAPSACAGWRVQDVAQHMASVFHSIADPTSIEGGTSTDVEQNAEVPVQARHTWTSQQVMDEYDEWSAKGIAALSMMQEPGTAEMVIPLGNLGSHPMHILGNAFVFAGHQPAVRRCRWWKLCPRPVPRGVDGERGQRRLTANGNRNRA